MATCQLCQTSGLEWSENPGPNGKNFLYNPNTGQKHAEVCKPTHLKPNPIPITTDHVTEIDKTTRVKRKIMLGFSVEIREEQKALAITKECERCGLDANKVRVERRGDFLIIH